MDAMPTADVLATNEDLPPRDMLRRATLMYLSPANQPIATFELDSPTTIVGRMPLGVTDLPQDLDLGPGKGTYHVRRKETLFVGISWDIAMCRQHFCIRRSITASGEAVYFLQDLNTRCGTYVNNKQVRAVVQLKHGDRIRCSSRFLFSLTPGSNDQATIRAGQSDLLDGPGRDGS
jgi:hypothetical protein